MKFVAARRLALALPEAVEAPHHHGTSFRIDGKIFATAPPDVQALHVFVSADERDRAMALHPRCVEQLSWGGKVVGVRVALARATPAMVRGLLAQAWRRKAPQHLVSLVDRH